MQVWMKPEIRAHTSLVLIESADFLHGKVEAHIFFIFDKENTYIIKAYW